MTVVIHKATALLIKDRKLLVVRAYDDDMFITVGGKIEPGETVLQALHRECFEELNIETNDDLVEKFATFYGTAIGRHAGKLLQQDTFFINGYSGKIQRSSEITELAWVNSHDLETFNLAPALKLNIIPALAKKGLID